MANEVLTRVYRIQAQTAQAQKAISAYNATIKKAGVDTAEFQRTASRPLNTSAFRNAGYQISDFAVQVSAGTSVTQAFTQQASQLAAGFGPVGIAISAVGATLGALAVGFSNAKESADDFDISVSEVESSVEALTELTDNYVLALQQSGTASDLSALKITANSKREFEARKQLLALEFELLAARNEANIAERKLLKEELDAGPRYESARSGPGPESLYDNSVAAVEQRRQADKAYNEVRRQYLEQNLQIIETEKVLAARNDILSREWTDVVEGRVELNEQQVAAYRNNAMIWDEWTDEQRRQIEEQKRLSEERDRVEGTPGQSGPQTNLGPATIIRTPEDEGVQNERERAADEALRRMEEYRTEIKKTQDLFKEAAAQNAAEGLTDALFDIAEGAKSAQEAFSDFATNFVKDIAEMIVKALIFRAVAAAFGLPIAPTGLLGPGANNFQLAKGGVVGGGGGPVGVVTPGAFGTMAENGPEAVMPLQRTASGDLGVRGVAPVVNIYNSTDSDVQVSESTASDGGKSLEVFISKQVDRNLASGRHDRTLANSFGVNRRSR